MQKREGGSQFGLPLFYSSLAASIHMVLSLSHIHPPDTLQS